MESEATYKMNKKFRGQALIISNEFKKQGPLSFLKRRSGYKEDLRMMEDLFTRLDFRVICHENLKRREMVAEIRTAAIDRINQESDCFVLVISTHGIEINLRDLEDKSGKTPAANVWRNAIFGEDGHPVFIDDIVKIFDCASGLKGKPKLFFIQACRSRHQNPVCNSKYDFGHWIYSKVDITEDVDNLYGDMKEKTLQHSKPVEDSMPGSFLQTEKDEESMSTVIVRQMEDGRGDQEEKTFLETSFDIIPINCPDDSLFMYPATPGKTAIRNSMGSLLLQFMCKGENVEILIKGNSLLQYLTYVSRDMATAEYWLDLEMTSESEDKALGIERLRKYLSHCTKKLSEDKQLVIKELRASHAENIKTKDDPILVERYLNDNLENFTVTEMQGLLKHLMPLKMCACIIHRLRGDILLTPKSKKSPMAKCLDYFRKSAEPPLE